MTAIIALPVTDESGLRDYVPVMASARAPRPRWPWLVLVAFLLGLALGAQLHAAEPCVQLQVRPSILLRRGDIDVQTRVRRHDHHRSFDLRWTSDVGSEGSSGPTPLEGEDARALFPLRLRDQPPGHYLFEARVFDSVGRQLGVARAEIRTPEASQ